MLHCFALKPPAPAQAESGAAGREKANISMIDYSFFLVFFFFFKETLEMPRDPWGFVTI